MSNNVPPEYINPVTNGFKLGRSTGGERERRVIEISNEVTTSRYFIRGEKGNVINLNTSELIFATRFEINFLPSLGGLYITRILIKFSGNFDCRNEKNGLNVFE